MSKGKYSILRGVDWARLARARYRKVGLGLSFWGTRHGYDPVPFKYEHQTGIGTTLAQHKHGTIACLLLSVHPVDFLCPTILMEAAVRSMVHVYLLL